MNWLTSQNAVFNSIHISAISAENRGIFATEDIEAGARLFYLPRHLLLSMQLAVDSEFGQAIMTNSELKSKMRYPWKTLLSVLCLQEAAKGKESKFYQHF